MEPRIHCFAWLFCIVNVFPLVAGEAFTALATLRRSLDLEKELANKLREYASAERGRINKVLELADNYEEHADNALLDAERYLANPVNAFLFVKRFTVDMVTTKELLSSNKNDDVILSELAARESELPDQEDFDGVVAAVLRLQDTYELPAHQITEGSFTPVNRSPVMSASECFEIGRYAYDMRDYYHTLMWMTEAWDMLALGDTNSNVDKPMLLDYLSYASHQQGNIRHAMQLTKEWLSLQPDHPRANGNLKYFEHELDQEDEQRRLNGLPVLSREIIPPLKNLKPKDSYRSGAEFQRYEALCRGEDLMPNPYEHRTRCYYSNVNRNPLLILAPAKVEEVYLDPLILFYHDCISDNEIEIIKNLATPRLKRATVNDPATGKLVTANYRVSRSAWLKDHENETVRTLTNRISAMTHINMEKAEELQVVNYGIGGQYEPHFDFARNRGPESSTFQEHEGNRVATWIYYFSNVEAGGLTVFTELGLKIPPIKGGAAFWWNLRKSGEGDSRTRHAGCPVLAGSKWGECLEVAERFELDAHDLNHVLAVANKWTHERGQEFMRPCGLSSKE